MTARFAPDWVLINEPATDEYQRVVAGKVLFHSRSRDEVDEKALELRPKHSAFQSLGTFPEHMVFGL